MSQHAPKQLALEAYLDGLLSASGRARLERHLERCAICRAAKQRMARYWGTVQAVREEPLPEIDWERVEASLERAAARPANTHANRRWLWPAVALAAAATLGWLGRQPTSPAPDTSAATSPPAAAVEPPADERAPSRGWVTLAANAVQVAAPGLQPTALDPSQPVHEGLRVQTGAAGHLHVRLGAEAGTGFALDADSSLELEELRQGRTRLRLLAGRVSCEVEKLGERDAFVVETGAHSVHVRGTRFAVERRGDEVRVEVEEGRVEVQKDGETRARVEAGSRWSSAGPEAAASPPSMTRVVGLTATDAQAWLVVQPSPMVSAWLPTGEGSPVKAVDALHMRLPPGPGSLAVLDRKGRRHQLQFTLAPEGAELTEADLHRQLAPREPRSGTLEVAQIMPVLKRGMGGLRTCYERALRGGHSGGAELSLELRVSTRGAVDRAHVEGDGVERELALCVEARARRWRFPAPEGGPARLRLPVNLRPKR